MGDPDGRPGIEGAGKWMALTAALLGWMFDGLEMGLFPLVARPALHDLLGTERRRRTASACGSAVATAAFLVGAATGGVLFGWLGDRVGRVRAMTLSVLTYALFSGLCGLARQPWHIVVLRFLAALGMGGEWSLGVALVMEIWPDRSRALLAGLIGAAANVGYLLVALVGLGAYDHSSATRESAPARPGLSPSLGRLPARQLGAGGCSCCSARHRPLLTFLIRLFVPESERWERENGAGRDLQLGRPATCSASSSARPAPA